MKKALKVLGAIIGGYAIFNMLCLAWIGAGRILRKSMENPTRSFWEIDDAVVEDTENDWKEWISLIKN